MYYEIEKKKSCEILQEILRHVFVFPRCVEEVRPEDCAYFEVEFSSNKLEKIKVKSYDKNLLLKIYLEHKMKQDINNAPAFEYNDDNLKAV